MKDVYLDYSATTPCNSEVLDTYIKVVNKYYANPNSLHKLGVEAKELILSATKQVANLLAVKESEIIFTSGATESNNLAIYGLINKYPNRGKHILTTHLEHSSINESLKYLEKRGYIIDYLKLDKFGKVDINDLKSKLNNDVILVTIAHVNSETGIVQDVNEIGKIIKDYKQTTFHVDGTQAIGKIKVKLDNIDMYTISSHKIYGIKGVGILVKKENIDIDPIIHGGKSQTIFRSGTPASGLIVAMSKALRLALFDIDNKYNHVKELSDYLKENLKNINNLVINSNQNSIPHIVNISVFGIKSETLQHSLELKNIYVSTKTACSKDSQKSEALEALGFDDNISKHSIRISISYLTTKEEIDYLIESLKDIINNI